MESRGDGEITRINGLYGNSQQQQLVFFKFKTYWAQMELEKIIKNETILFNLINN